MEIKTELKKPYTEEQIIKFIVEQNHKLGYTLEEADNALLAWGYTEEEKAEQERERINMLFMTGADVERAIYKVKGMDFYDILKMMAEVQNIDVKA